MRTLNKRCFECVYRDYYMVINKFIYKKIVNYSDAEMLTSDVFFKAFKHYEKFDPSIASEKTWLFTITQNILKNYYRDRKRIKNIEDYMNSDELVMQDELENAVYIQEVRDELAKALKELPERESKIIVLKWFKNKSAREIACILGLSEGNVRTIASRAKKDLKTILENNGFEWRG